MTDTVIEALHWLGLAGAVAAIVIYFAQITMRPQSIRLISGAGLFFTGVGLAMMANPLPRLPIDMQLGAALGVLALLVAVYFQGAASLRGRKGDRRTSTQAGAR